MRFEVSNAMKIKMVAFYVMTKSYRRVLRIREVLSSYFGPDTYPDCDFRGFLQFFQTNAGTVTRIRPQPLPSTTVPMYSLIILPFDAVQPEPVTV
jgi:hypothetical protein